ncbi:hypothetical protein [Nonomuraea turcica]|uniref:hypothetical protein n=1 Tax=Nonomuraea sp. G32 TaxID=3067274 RepID=UPI00273CE917|nr:hypothetical protein [Nonomuraea sp. G32]MDP4512056.1 hypothetical protein [Nonomuraea sp. G32]
MADDIVGSARIRVELDDSGVERQARATGRRLSSSFKGSGADAADEFVRDAQGRLRDARGRFVAEGVQIGRAIGQGAGRGASLLAIALGVAAGGLTKLVAGAGAVTSLSIALASTASSAVGLAAALAPAAGIIAALPAGVLLLQSAVATLGVALAGVGEAFEAALTEDAAKFEESLAGLSPAARSVARELRAVKPEIDELRAAVQDALFAPLQGEITRLVGTLRGPLTAGMSATTGELARLGLSVTRFASSAAGVDLVSRVFESLRLTLTSIDSATLDRLLVAVSGFVTSSLPAFDGLGDAIDAALNRLSGFLEEATLAGDAMVWVDQAIEVFRELGSIVADSGAIILGVFDAVEASGQDTLGSISAVLERVRAFVESGQGQVALVETFRALRTVGGEFGDVLAVLLTQLGRIAPIVADLSTSVGGGLAGALQAVGSGLVALGPGVIATFEAIESAISRISQTGALTSLAAGASDLLEAALAPLIPAAINIGTALGDLGPAASLFAAVLTPIVSLISGVTSAFASLPGPLQAAGLALIALVALRSRVAAFGETLAQLPQRLSSQAVGTATRSISVLRSGISGLLGLVGGPWGLAIAAGVTAISLFGQRQAEAAQKVSDLTATLDEQTGGLTENTRQWVVNELHQRGTLDLAKRPGIDTALVTQAVLGQEEAVKQLNAALDANLEAAAARAGSNLPGALEGELVNAGNLRVAVGELSATYKAATSDARLKAEASREIAFAEQGAAQAVRDVTAAMKAQADELRAQVDPAFAFQQALQGVADKQNAYTRAVRESGKGSREARIAALELANQSAELATAAGALGDAFSSRLTPSMRSTLRAAGLTKAQIAAVEGALRQTKDAAEDYQGTYRANVQVRGAAAAEAQIRNLNAVIADVERSVTIGITANVNLRSLPAFAEGGIVDHPTIAMIGEGHRREVVIPLTKPERVRQLAHESGLADMLATPGAGSGGAAARGGDGAYAVNHTWNIYEVGDAEATAERVINRLVLAAEGL